MIKNLKAYLDRVTLVIIILFILTVISVMVISNYVKEEKNINTGLNAQLTEMRSIKDKFIKLKQTIDIRERKIGLTKTEGIISILEQGLNTLGIKSGSVRHIARNNIEGYIVEDAELEVKDVDLNRVVNLLYRIENSPSPLRIKSAFIKTSFDDPNKFILRLTVTLISK